MAEHKVPQDIEAEDKILGPFSFRQFIYLIIAVAGGAAAFGLWQLAPPLAILPLPVIGLFLILALPLRKDQPMETFVAAMVRFWFTPRVRLWDPDGSDMMVEITNPPIDDDPIARKIKGDEAVSRLSLLSEIEDSQGWVTRGVINNTSLNDELAASAGDAPDVLADSSTADKFNSLLDKSDQATREAAISRMNSVRENPAPAPISREDSPIQVPERPETTFANPPASANENPAPQPNLSNPYLAAVEQPTSPQPVISTASASAEDESAAEQLLAANKTPEYSATNNIREKVIQPVSAQPTAPEIREIQPPAPIVAPEPKVEPTPPPEIPQIQEQPAAPEIRETQPEKKSDEKPAEDFRETPSEPAIIENDDANVSRNDDDDFRETSGDNDDEFEIDLH